MELKKIAVLVEGNAPMHIIRHPLPADCKEKSATRFLTCAAGSPADPAHVAATNWRE